MVPNSNGPPLLFKPMPLALPLDRGATKRVVFETQVVISGVLSNVTMRQQVCSILKHPNYLFSLSRLKKHCSWGEAWKDRYSHAPFPPSKKVRVRIIHHVQSFCN